MALLLSRLKGETIRIGDDIEITIAELNGHSVTVAIDAPSEIAVHREEIYQRIHKGSGSGSLLARSNAWVTNKLKRSH